MQVQITETALIVPKTTPFHDDHVLQLSPIDNDPNLRVTFRYLRAYAATSADPFPVIAAALASALYHFYPLAGSLRPHANDNLLELACNKGDTVPFVRAAADCTLDAIADVSEQLAPDPSTEDGLANPCVLQLTRFACGGYVLGAAIHHALCDGAGAALLFEAVAEVARGGSGVSVEPVWERDVFLRGRELPRHVDGPIGDVVRPYEQAIGAVVSEIFRVSDECLDGFKKELLRKSGLSFTTFEALGAFIWRAKVKASKISGSETVTFVYSLNARKLVKPPLPGGYWGNACVPMYVKLSAKALTENPLRETAELIKKSKRDAGDEYVRAFVDFLAAPGGEQMSEVSAFTDWRHLGHSKVDFSWGGPVTVLPLSHRLLGGLEPCFFLPASPAEKGGFKVYVALREAAMPVFKAEMGRFCDGNFEL